VHTATAAAYGVITTGLPDDRRTQLDAGRLLQRIHLTATSQGIALQHMNQITERIDREATTGAAPNFAPRFAALLPPVRTQVAPLLSVMAVTSVLGAGSFMIASFLAALGQNFTLVRIEAVSIGVLVAALVLLSRWGVVAASFAVGIALIVQFTLSASACRRHGLSLDTLGGPLVRVLAACLVMVAGVLLSRWWLAPILHEAKAVLLACEIAVGALLYAACLRLFGRGLLQDVFRLLSASGKAELQQVSTAFQSAKANHD
jgi:PST family polysaccharide transporter